MTQTLSRIENIDKRIDRAVAGGIGVNPSRGLVVGSIDQAMEVAKLMSVSDTAVPRHLRGNPGACLAIAIQGYEWAINPFALANKSYVVNDRLGYESALYHAVVQRRAPIRGRIKMEYAGKGDTRTCKVWANLTDDDGTVEYTTPEFSKIPVKNSPLWKGDPDQQLFYYAIRAFARRHFPDVMMGIATTDELQDSTEIVADNQSPAGTRAQGVLRKITQQPPVTDRPVSENQTLEPNPDFVNMRNVNPETGEELDQPKQQETDSRLPEPDTSGVDHQPPDDQVETKAVDESQTAGDAPIGFTEECLILAREMALEPVWFKAQLKKAINLANKVPGSKSNQLTDASKVKIRLAIASRTGDFAPKAE